MQDMRKSLDTEGFIERAKAIHGDAYGYDRAKFVSWKTPITITCKIHGDFEQWPETHLRGAGCKRCKIKAAKKLASQKAASQFVERANQIHGGKYDYTKSEYVASSQKVIIICSKHGEFLQSPGNHLQGQGCPARLRRWRTEDTCFH